jgi:hypothetical protein
MFNFLKKKNNSCAHASIEDFAHQYTDKEKHVILGKINEANIELTLGSKTTNNVMLINDNQKSVIEESIVPTIMQSNLSYVIYDPGATYYNALEGMMKSKGYDVQTIDFEDNEHRSRVDLFEIANITKNPYWISVILAGSIHCQKYEIVTAHCVFMAIMQHLLDINGSININDMKSLFDRLCSDDEELIAAMLKSTSTTQYISQITKEDKRLIKSVFDKISEHFFATAINKTNNPNVFTVTSHQKKTILFIQKVPEQYRYLTTIMMFNLKASSIMYGRGNVNTLIINPVGKKWYNKKLLDKACVDSGLAMDKGVARLTVKKTIKNGLPEYADRVIAFAHSDNECTKDIVCRCLMGENVLCESEKTLNNRPTKHKKIKKIAALCAKLEANNDIKCVICSDGNGDTKTYSNVNRSK